MDRNEFIVATSAILFIAFLLGWFASWLIHRLTRASEADIGELERMAHALHEAEDIRDQALAYAHAREAELKADLHEARAELAAAMDGLRAARAECEELRDYIERVQQRI
ncbi:hypothetical protein [Roseitranquillus sediminis]|uniref:hypothetical protein n=1 Tax=Roseitranquillus sediminis TaxID=2809051 RepID=UPI001D0C19E2|nr:hypothetical protein [Roseitranquillus sediminis]MBM9593352.1 hypothetical protein [Roseitranquillus sediminis]